MENQRIWGEGAGRRGGGRNCRQDGIYERRRNLKNSTLESYTHHEESSIPEDCCCCLECGSPSTLFIDLCCSEHICTLIQWGCRNFGTPGIPGIYKILCLTRWFYQLENFGWWNSYYGSYEVPVILETDCVVAVSLPTPLFLPPPPPLPLFPSPPTQSLYI